MFEIYRLAIFREVYAPLWHKATLFTVIFTVSSLFVPFLIAYRSGGFWQRDLIYFEKPKIRFLRQSYFELRSPSGLRGWSTYTNLNAQLGDSLLIPQMTVSEVDDDGDGLYDHVTLSLKFRTTELITGVYALLFFEVHFKEQLVLTLQTPVLIQFIGPDKMGGLRYSHVGSLSLYQMQPLVQGQTYNEYNVSLFGGRVRQLSDVQVKSVEEFLSKRKVSIKLENEFSLWMPGTPSLSRPFTIDIKIFYPPVSVWAHPSFWYMTWWGWIQYFPILLVSLFISDRIKYFVFAHNLFTGCWQRRDKLLTTQKP
ncbi:hypothetical protein PHET_05242 [Paragonimus heterotremus]|uniref:Transmembrane protein 231 n=1 Tax=Paragonimus heterotremus TaxID=100268 RepID=A0A8J4SPB7_9TREM|nr:hypothetical protein PHET_05242 [Paragonimus heterotremus]